MVEVCTSRLRLRPPRRDDATDLAKLMTPAISARLASWPPHMDPASAQLRLEAAAAAMSHGTCLPLIITRLSDGEILGWISACRTDADPRRAILTYWVGEAFHGQGIMREAAPAALEAVFRELDVQEVRAAVQSDNGPSHAILRLLGMAPLGLGRIWCAARGREESCEWWAVRRSQDQTTSAADPACVVAAPSMALALSGVSL